MDEELRCGKGESFIHIPSPSLSDCRAQLSLRCPSSQHSLVPGMKPGVSPIIHPLQLLVTSKGQGQNNYPHFTDEETEVQRGRPMARRSHSKSMWGQSSTPDRSTPCSQPSSAWHDSGSALCPRAEASAWLPQKQGLLAGSLPTLPAPGITNIR